MAEQTKNQDQQAGSAGGGGDQLEEGGEHVFDDLLGLFEAVSSIAVTSVEEGGLKNLEEKVTATKEEEEEGKDVLDLQNEDNQLTLSSSSPNVAEDVDGVKTKEQLRRLALKKLEEDRRTIQQNLEFMKEDPFLIMPEVVMRELIKRRYLSDPQDKASVYRISPSFQAYLEGSKTAWMFNKLFAIPAFQKAILDIPPDPFTPCTLSSFQALRSISSDWRKSLDKFFDKCYDSPLDYSNLSSLMCQKTGRYTGPKWETTAISKYPTTKFRGTRGSSSSIQSFLHILNIDLNDPAGNENPTASAFSNPFPTRRVSLWLDNNDEREVVQFWPLAHSLLQSVGGEIRWADLNPCIPRETARALMNLPNIQCLLLDLRSDRSRHALQVNHDDLPDLPPIPSLKRLKLLYCNSILYIEKLGAYYDQLVTLSIHYTTSFMDWYRPGTHSTFPKLQQLCIEVSGVKALLKLNGFKSPLKEISINIGEHTGPSAYLWCLAYFKETLVAARIEQFRRLKDEPIELQDIELELGLEQGQSETIEVALPKLKILAITISCARVDHLLMLSTPPEILGLEIIKCQHKTHCYEDECDWTSFEDELDVHKWIEQGQMYKSNVWQKWKGLKEIYVRTHYSIDKDQRYNRKEFEERMKKEVSNES